MISTLMQHREGFPCPRTGAVVLCVVSLAGSAAEAQTPVAAEVPVVAVPRSPPPTPEEIPMVPQPPPETSAGMRIVVESLAGLGVGASFALTGGLIGYGVGEFWFGRFDHDNRASLVGAATISGLALGWTFGVPFGVMFAGRARGRTERFREALLGSFTGLVISALVDPLVIANRAYVPTGQICELLGADMLFMAFSSVLVSELLSRAPQDHVSAGASHFTLMPGLAAVRGGETVGLVGSF